MPLVLLLAAAAAPAQVTVIDPPPRPAAEVPDSYMTLEGRGCAVRFEPGGLDRAHHVLRRIELITQHFNRWSDVPVPLATYVVDRESWTDLELPGVYGIPLRSGATTVAVPAEGDEGTVRMWRSILGVEQIPMVPGQPLQGTPEGAGTLAIADVLLQIEAARGFVQRARLLGEESWVGEVAAHSAALSLFWELERPRYEQILALFATVNQRLGGAGAHPMSDYSPTLLSGSDDDILRWLWYQAAFSAAASNIVRRDGKKTVNKLMRLAAKNGHGLPAAALLASYPDLQGWLYPTSTP